ncbi:hypothetical protein Barb7_02943 [Bacteroidales bacterium Barb7]|nr:hypothetical protein Barb7_02943 [Bacteroidales bacterium Barb7]
MPIMLLLAVMPTSLPSNVTVGGMCLKDSSVARVVVRVKVKIFPTLNR